MKLEYIALIILTIGFYNYSVKDYIKNKKNREFVEENLVIGSKIITNSGIIGEVNNIKDVKVEIITGDKDNISYITIEKKEIKSIID